MNNQDSTGTADLLPQLRAASEGLYFISETDYPFEVVHLPDVQDSADLPAALTEQAEVADNAAVDMVELPYFFRNMTREEPDAGEEEQNTARRFRELQAFLKQHLQEVKVYRIGRRRIQAYILGRTATGDFVGLKTMLVET